MSGPWRVALRLARRDLAAHRLRTALTAALIGLPVLFAAVLSALALRPNNLGFAVASYLPISLLIALLAIPAFGVTARTRRDELSLIESAGGNPADLSRVVAAVGLVTGLLGVVAALLLAVPLWIAMVALVNRLDEGQRTVLSGMDLALWPLLAAFALAASVVAAVVTSRTTAGATEATSGPPNRAVLASGLGIGLLGLAGVLSVGADTVAIAPWTTLLALGVVLTVPTLVHLVGRAGARLPLAARLSVRDADRHRSRTAPAIASVMAGVAAVTALGIGSSSDVTDRQAETDMYRMPIGAVTVDGSTSAIRAAATRSPGGLDVVPLPAPDNDAAYVSLPNVDRGPRVALPLRDLVVADAETLAAWGVTLDASGVAALDAGKALAGPTVDVRGGEVRADLLGPDGEEVMRRLTFSAAPADLSLQEVPAGNRPVLAGVVLPPSLAQRLDLDPVANEAVVDRRRPAPTDAQLRALRDLPGIDVAVQETSFYDGYALVFSLLALLGLGIVGLATGTAVALARIDGRQDTSTLVAVGARPSTARWTAASTALLIGGIGSVLGLAVGVVPGVRAALALTGGYGDRFLSIPWALLTTVGIGVPALVAAIAFLTASTRSGGPAENLR